jgi:ribonuclease HI
MQATIDKWCHRAALRLTTLPPEHPLHGPVKRSASRYVKRHRSPLHFLAQAFNIKASRVVKTPATGRNPAHAGKRPFRTSIAVNKEASIEEDAKALEKVKVYSDGSAQDGKVGAAAVLIHAGKASRTLRYHLGPDTEHTVHEAELVGILLAMQLIQSEKAGRTTFAIGVDNQVAIATLRSNLRGPGHHIAREIWRVANRLQKERGNKKFAITIRWTAGHEGIEGNELADKEAKDAAEGETTEKPHLPPFLRCPLTINPAAVKQAYNKKSKEAWTNDWRTSVRGRKMLKIDGSTPSAKFLKLISGTNITRKAASIISQLRIGHAPLNAYLHRFKRVDSARCPACGAAEETTEHFLLKCEAYAYERQTLKKKLEKKKTKLSLETLLSDERAATLLVKYTETTHRFDQPGEPSSTAE